MAQKKISDLTLRSSASDACQIPVDDSTQTWRITVAQINANAKTSLGATRNDLYGGTSGGAADVQTLTPTNALTSYAAGGEITFLAGYTNTGAATMAISGLAAKALKQKSGAALVAGDITSGRLYKICYDGTNLVLLGEVEDASITRARLATGAMAKASQTAIKTTTYAVLTSDDTILVSGSGSSWSATLPTAVGATGRRYKFVRTDNTLANIVTIATTSSQTINGVTTFKLCTQYEMVEVESDGANWYIVNRYIPSGRLAYTPTFTGFGTPTNVNVISWREGNYLMLEGYFTTGTATAVEARMELGFAGTSGNVTSLSTLPTVQLCGKMNRGSDMGATYFTGEGVLIEASKTYACFSVESSTVAGLTKATASSHLGSTTTHSFFARVPITNWES